MVDRASLLSGSGSHAASWLSVVPSPAWICISNPMSFTHLSGWLELDTSVDPCVLCALKELWTPSDTMQLHVVMEVISVVIQHNFLRDFVAHLFRQAHMRVSVEMGNGLTPDHSHSWLQMSW